MKSLAYSLAIALAVILPHTVLAQHHQLTDEIFAKKAAAGGLTEVQLGQLAEQNGASQAVKDFGAKMASDHGKANDNLKSVASKDSLTIPDKPNAEQQAMIDKLSKEKGDAFDKAYVHAMLRAHVQDRALFKEEIASAKNPDLKQFASDTLPVIEQHLDMIKKISENGPGAASGSSVDMKMAPPTASKSGVEATESTPGTATSPQ